MHSLYRSNETSDLLGRSPAEEERLRRQASELASETQWLLDQFAIRRGARAIDLGCGPQGRSLGGLYMQYFARNYPQEVAGLLLVDSTHWQQLDRLKSETPASYRTLRLAELLMVPIMKRELAADSTSQASQGARKESQPRGPAPEDVLEAPPDRRGPSLLDTAEFRDRPAIVSCAGGRTMRAGLTVSISRLPTSRLSST